MATCTECYKDLKYLDVLEQCTQLSTLDIVEGRPNWEVIDHTPHGRNTREYRCPNCLSDVAYSEDEAIELLKGGK